MRLSACKLKGFCSMARLIPCLIFLAFAAACGESPSDAAKWGRENIAAGKYKEAVELLTKELENLKEPAAAKREIVFVLVEAQRIMGKFKEARELLDKLLTDEPDAKKNADIRLLLAELDID